MNTSIYAPQNSKQLSEEQIAAMQVLTLEELKELAAAYPNQATQIPYLVMKDTNKKDKDQTNPLATWQNLYEIRKMGLKNFVAISFKNIFHKEANVVKTAPVQDLTNQEAKEGLKAIPGGLSGNVKSSPVLSANSQIAKEVTDDEEFPDLTADAKQHEKAPKPKTKPKGKNK